MTNEAAKGLGRGAPYGLKACQILQTPSCPVVDLNNPQSPAVPTVANQPQKVRLEWQPVTVGSATYLVYRRRASGPQSFTLVERQQATSSSMQTRLRMARYNLARAGGAQRRRSETAQWILQSGLADGRDERQEVNTARDRAE